MAHLVKVDDTVFRVPGRLVRDLLSRYASGETIDYDAINRELTENSVDGGDAPETPVKYKGYFDFDEMKEKGLRVPVRIDGYDNPL